MGLLWNIVPFDKGLWTEEHMGAEIQLISCYQSCADLHQPGSGHRKECCFIIGLERVSFFVICTDAMHLSSPGTEVPYERQFHKTKLLWLKESLKTT